MTINGLGGLPAAYRPAGTAAPKAAAPAGTPAHGGTAPAMPAGADPSLWAVLTSDEKAFFVDQQRLGAATYGPAAKRTAAMAPAPLGARIDVRA